MPRFAYSAYANTGRLVKGEIDAECDASALDILALRGLTPISVSAGTSAAKWWERELSFGGSGVKDQELGQFFANFSAMLNAQFPLLKALQFCHDQTRNPRLKHSLRSARDAVENGKPLHDAFRQEGKVFPSHLISLVELGEQSNTLAYVVQKISSMLKEQIAVKRELQGALIYPLILLVMAVLVLALIVFYLSPALLPVFSSAGAQVPLPLRVMLAIRTTVIEGWPALMVGTAVLILALSYFKGMVLAFCQPLLRCLPVLGRYIRQSETLGFCQTMALMLGSGASVTQALATSRQTNRSGAFRSLIVQAEAKVTDGGLLSEALIQSPLMDPMAAAMIEAAEETNRLPETLQTIVDDLSARLRATLKQAMQLLTPILTLVIGITVGAVILTTISAIMDINDIAI